ncbi:hypothetical protein GCM10010191_30320 [Actinomadura vinacea]|uniref:Uncharacterized protein n=1 Tax=Actinomadura vinacea TaxID=115336 RepID=A0ABP5W5B8_9ACTN
MGSAVSATAHRSGTERAGHLISITRGEPRWTVRNAAGTGPSTRVKTSGKDGAATPDEGSNAGRRSGGTDRADDSGLDRSGDQGVASGLPPRTPRASVISVRLAHPRPTADDAT